MKSHHWSTVHPGPWLHCPTGPAPSGRNGMERLQCRERCRIRIGNFRWFIVHADDGSGFAHLKLQCSYGRNKIHKTYKSYKDKNFRQVNLGPFMSPGCQTSKGVKCLPLILLWKSVVKSRAIQAKKNSCILLHSGLSCLRAYLVHSSSWDGYSVRHLEKLVILQSKYHRMFLFLFWRCFHQPQFSTQAAVLHHSPQLPCTNKRQLVTQRISDVIMYVIVLLGQERNQQFSASWHIGLLCAQNVWIFCITMEKLIPSSQDRKPRKPPEQDGSGGLCDVSFPWKDRMSTGLASEFENCPGKLHFLQRLGRKLLGSNHDTCLSGIREYHDDPC